MVNCKASNFTHISNFPPKSSKCSRNPHNFQPSFPKIRVSVSSFDRFRWENTNTHISSNADVSSSVTNLNNGIRVRGDTASSRNGSPGIKDRKVECEVEVISWRERRIKAQISVDADVESVWDALTDYERLADFIPNLVSSRRIPCPYSGRIWLEQRGLQQALYWHIEARVVLDLQEFPNSANGRELHFCMVDGDFKKFEGKWSVISGKSTLNSDQEGQDLLSLKFRGQVICALIYLHQLLYIPKICLNHCLTDLISYVPEVNDLPKKWSGMLQKLVQAS